MSDTAPVVMLDRTDLTLHRVSHQLNVTACGISLDKVSVGPLRALLDVSSQLCTSCWAPASTNLFEQGGSS